MTATLALTRLSGHFAARIDTPFDELLDEASHQALRDALVDHKVLMLPGADPSIEQHIALATVFGDAEPPQPQNPRHEDSILSASSIAPRATRPIGGTPTRPSPTPRRRVRRS